jgi:3-phenylpropionate/trans-cinnamate dioxygenase ferredoxin reductase subunit
VNDGLVIVGGCYAGAQIAASARDAGYGEPIRLVSEEVFAPYQRPPLSKGFLTGKLPQTALPLRGEAFYRDNAVELLLSTRATRIDRAGRIVETATGVRLRYDKLALTVGARPRPLPLPGSDLDGVLELRSLADALAIRERLPEVSSVAIIGGGFIGLEAASALITLGKSVTVIEAQERLLMRAIAPRLAEFLADEHRRRGVRLLLRSTVREIKGDGRHVRAVVTSDSETFAADLLLVAIGVTPNVGLAEGCGLACDDGIVVDRFAQTGDPDIVAAGDCTRHPSSYATQPLRLESVQNAIDQAKAAAAGIAGAPKAYDAVPWFWSDQYELKLQMVGLSQGHDICVTRGRLDDGRFALLYLRGGTLIAVDTVNRPADHMLGRKLVTAQVRLTPEQAADESLDLKRLLPA